jgi:hypothetical protein
MQVSDPDMTRTQQGGRRARRVRRCRGRGGAVLGQPVDPRHVRPGHHLGHPDRPEGMATPMASENPSRNTQLAVPFASCRSRWRGLVAEQPLAERASWCGRLGWTVHARRQGGSGLRHRRRTVAHRVTVLRSAGAIAVPEQMRSAAAAVFSYRCKTPRSDLLDDGPSGNRAAGRLPAWSARPWLVVVIVRVCPRSWERRPRTRGQRGGPCACGNPCGDHRGP